MASTIDKPGKYKITVTMSAGYDECEVTFNPPDKVTVTSLGNNVYEIDVKEGAKGTIQVLVNNDHCSDNDIDVSTTPVQSCECSYLSVTANTAIPNVAATNVVVATYESTNEDCSFEDVNVVNVEPHDWINIVGTSNGKIIANVTANQKDEPRSAQIAITGKTSDGKDCTEWEVIRVTQNPPSCTPTSCTCYMVSTATAATVPADATSTSVTWSYSAITWTTASTCEVSSSMTTSTSSTTVNFEAARCDSIGRTGSFPWDNHPACDNKSCSSSNVIVSWEVNQEKPEGCGCTFSWC